jgi:trehalose/maltose hydrolase-like predicted phosphorylase
MQGGNVPGGLGLDLEFLESVLYPQVMLFGFMGFEPKMDGFDLHPKLPKDWSNFAIDRIRWQDQSLIIRATHDAMDITFIGPERSVKINLPAGRWNLVSAQGTAKTVTSHVDWKTTSGETVRLERIR